MLADDVLDGLDVHCLDEAGLNVPLGTGPEWLPAVTTLFRGETLRLSAEIVDATRDRYGFSFFALADDPEAQFLRWGKVRIGIGPSPVPTAAAVQRSEKYVIANSENAVFGARQRGTASGLRVSSSTQVQP